MFRLLSRSTRFKNIRNIKIQSSYYQYNCYSCNINLSSLIMNQRFYRFKELSRTSSFKHFISNFVPCNHYSLSQPSVTKECWKCNSANIYNGFCKECEIIQPLEKNLNYFEVLRLKKSFKINRDNLIKDYRLLQSKFHPDKFSIRTKEEQDYAAQHSSMVNKAYNTILHPVSRGEYMLSIAGHPIEEGELTMDPVFLMDIMEINERLAEATEKDTLRDISIKNNAIMDTLIKEAEAAFESDDITSAREIVAKLKYYKNIYEKVKERETKYGIMY